MEGRSKEAGSPKTSLISEVTLWQLYRRLLRAHWLDRHLVSHGHKRGAQPARAIVAALTENLLAGDTLGLEPHDLVTRCLWGMPLSAIVEAAQERPREPERPAIKENDGSWALAGDVRYGLLPATGANQARLATGVALSSRLHASGRVTVLLRKEHQGESGRVRRSQRSGLSSLGSWLAAADTAVALTLPLLFVTESEQGLSYAVTGPWHAAPKLPAIPVDRSDAVALYRVIYESAARARTGGGPTWIDCQDPAARHPGSRSIERPASHEERAGGQALMEPGDPLLLLEQVLRTRKLFDRDRQRQIERALEKEFAQVGWAVRGNERATTGL